MGKMLIPNKTLIDDYFKIIRKTLTWIKRRNSTEEYLRVKKSVDSTISFKKEFCSISLNLPRRSGNTTLALKLFESIKDCYLAFPTTSFLDDARVKKLDKRKILSPNKFRGAKGSVMIIDMASCFSPKRLDTLYTSSFEYYILLG